jgi:16S rRNA (uracil1498-N3)-methyltransferase
MPVFFIHSKQISGHALQITDSLARHIGGALRYRVGDQIFVVDEQRVGYTVELVEVKPNQIVGKILEEKKQPPASPIHITLGQAILKAKKMDWILQKTTELGVSKIVPVVTERTIVEPRPERADTQHRRWREILKEAAQQTGRWEAPELDPPTDFFSFVKNAIHFDLALMPWEGENQKDIKQCLKETLHRNPDIRHILILIGPEGGFSEQEVAVARKHRIIPVTLGWRILRAETACLATLTMLQYELGDMGYEQKHD